MSYFPASYTIGAALLHQLQNLAIGECARISRDILNKIEVPANPLDRQTPEYIIKWMHERLQFYAKLRYDIANDYWEITNMEAPNA